MHNKLTVLNVFEVNGRMFSHEINTENDSTYILDDEGFVHFEVDSSGCMTDGHEKTFGNFYTDGLRSTWFFSLTPHGVGPEKIVTAEKDLIKAEFAIFKFLLNVKLS